jgi:hypothetical protein
MLAEFVTTDFVEKEKVFDTSLYINLPKKRRVKVIANDLAGLVLEAGDRPLEDRINPWYIAITPEGNAINLLSRENVTKNFNTKTLLSRSETKGATDFYYNKALNAKPGDFIFWFSPSEGNSPYKEARINVAKVRTLFGLKVLECYGIPSKISPQEILEIANYFQIMSEDKVSSDPEELRELAILWPTIVGENTWEIFEKAVKLDSNAWETIKTGKSRKVKNEAYKAALPAAKRLNEDLKKAQAPFDFIKAGARAEMHMIQNGFNINSEGCPGVFNSELLQKSMAVLGIDALGNYRKTTFSGEKKSKYVKKCPYCDATIEKIIEPGYKCSCGQVFEGVC